MAIRNGRWLDHDEIKNISERIKGLATGGGDVSVSIRSWWNGELRWARNRVSLASDRRDVNIRIIRTYGGSVGISVTNQFDDESLTGAVRAAERMARRRQPANTLSSNADADSPPLPRPTTTIWSEATSSVPIETRAAIAQVLAEGAEAKNLISAGYLEMRVGTRGGLGHRTLFGKEDQVDEGVDGLRFDRWTQAQCSMTVRHPKGLGSGWAGLSGYDWTAINSEALAKVALDKCQASLNPVRIEPGRYTVILEPQAVSALTDILMRYTLRDRGTEAPQERSRMHPFWLTTDESLRIGRSKLGLRVIDERISISHDPADPLLGVLPEGGMSSLTWIDHGILTTLTLPHHNTRKSLRNWLGAIDRPAFHMSGGTTGIDEMIASTERGLLVTQLSRVGVLESSSMLCTGLTRNGLWLIEKGKISKAAHNMRFTESPLFAFNQVVQLGVPLPVFRPVADPYEANLTPAIVPPLKVRDFSFTALIDAV